MAQIQRNVDRAQDITTCIVSGPVSVDDVCAELKQLYTCGPTRNILWDFSAADVSNLATDDLRTIAATAKNLAPARPGGRTALVADSNLAFGIGRMYEIISDVQGHPIQHQIFRTRKSALDWLALPAPEALGKHPPHTGTDS